MHHVGIATFLFEKMFICTTYDIYIIYISEFRYPQGKMKKNINHTANLTGPHLDPDKPHRPTMIIKAYTSITRLGMQRAKLNCLHLNYSAGNYNSYQERPNTRNTAMQIKW